MADTPFHPDPARNPVSRCDATYVDVNGSRRFAAMWSPTTAPVRDVLVLAPPFGEELNKARRTLAQSARTLAAHGHGVLIMDLYGCGDSEGEFGDATWSRWCDDLRAAAARMRAQHDTPVVFWSVRAGALFAPDVHDVFDRFVLWQPVVQGENYVTQVLRVKVAADGFVGLTTTTKSLRAELEEGRSLEIAGYDLGPELLVPLSQRSLNKWTPARGDVIWIETGAEASGQCSPAAAQVAQRLRSSGTHVHLEWVRGEPFWMTLEIAENRALAEQTVSALAPVTA